MMKSLFRVMTAASGLLFCVLLLVMLIESNRPQPTALAPVVTGETEYCLTCHAGLPEISASHPVETFGCVICHGGERLAIDADLAHSTMRGGANPSDLSVVEASCGGSACHGADDAPDSDHIQRVMTSVQSTYAGAIGNIRYTFGAQSDLVAHQGIFAVTDDQVISNLGVASLSAFDPVQDGNPYIQLFADNCLTCHVGGQPHDGAAFARLTGCASCHTPDVASYADGQIHKLTTAISYTQCNTCHNRGNYDLRTMTFVERADNPTSRKEDYYQPIAEYTQCEWTLDCIDCHTGLETMGDGDIYSNQHDIQYTQCLTCHGTATELPLYHTITSADDPALKSAFLNPVTQLSIGDTILMTSRGEPLWNTRVLSDGSYELVGKATGQTFPFNPVMGSNCEQNPTEQESRYCHECHAVDH
jgi:hypothetical protein